MEKFIKHVTYIVENSILEEKEKNKLLRFIEMVKKDVEDTQKSEQLYNRQKNCFYKSYQDYLIYACICSGIEDIMEQISKLYAQKIIVGKPSYESIKSNRVKAHIMHALMNGKEVIIVDDGKEYEEIGKNVGGKIFKNIHDKEYFENVALKYLKAIPSSTTYYDAKHNIPENMEKIEEYPLLKEVLIHVNPVETVRIGLDLIGSKVALHYEITVADILSQLRGKVSVPCEVLLANKGDLYELTDSCNNKFGVYFIRHENGKLHGLNQHALCPVVAHISAILSLKLIEPNDGKILNTKEFKYAETF